MSFNHELSVANHRITRWTFANAAARLAKTGFTSADKDKVARDADTNTYWAVIAVASGLATWKSISGFSEAEVISIIKANVYAPMVVAGFNQDLPYIAGTDKVPSFVTDSNGDIYLTKVSI